MFCAALNSLGFENHLVLCVLMLVTWMQLMLWFVTNDVAYLVLLTLEASVAGILFRLLLRRLGSNLPHPLPLGYEPAAAVYINGSAILLCLYGRHAVQFGPPDVYMYMLWGALLAVLLFATPFLDIGTEQR